MVDPEYGEPAKVIIANLVTDEAREVQYNPTTLGEEIAVGYSKLVVPGLSHPVAHYSNTDAVKYNFELRYSAVGGGPEDLKVILEDRKFLYSLTHPWRSETIGRGGPPRILFVWPSLISLTCRVASLGFEYTDFNRAGAPVRYTAKLALEEVRDVFRSMEDIREGGTILVTDSDLPIGA